MRNAKRNQSEQVRELAHDGAVDAPIRLIMGMMALGMIVGALTAPNDATDQDGGALASVTATITSFFETRN